MVIQQQSDGTGYAWIVGRYTIRYPENLFIPEPETKEETAAFFVITFLRVILFYGLEKKTHPERGTAFKMTSLSKCQQSSKEWAFLILEVNGNVYVV